MSSRSTEWAFRLLDMSQQPLSPPYYIGRLKSGEKTRAIFLVENLDDDAEEISFRPDIGWMRVVEAPRRLQHGKIGRLVLEFDVPHGLTRLPPLHLNVSLFTMVVF